MKKIMIAVVFLIAGCQGMPSMRRPQYVRLLPSIRFIGAGFSETAGLVKHERSGKDDYEYFYGLVDIDTNVVRRFLSDEFITNSCYELHFEWHVATSDLVHYFPREFKDAGWKEKECEMFGIVLPSGSNWMRVYEKRGMKIQAHFAGLSSDDPEEYDDDDFNWLKSINFAFLNCKPDDVFDPAELYTFTNGVSSAEFNFNQIPGGYRKLIQEDNKEDE